jgi:hypothetical protein
MKKKTYTIKIKLKGKNVPDFGLGKGIISETEMSFTDEHNWGFDHPSFLQSKWAAEEKLIAETVECIWEEK